MDGEAQMDAVQDSIEETQANTSGAQPEKQDNFVECCACMLNIAEIPRITICGWNTHQICLKCFHMMMQCQSEDYAKCPVCRTTDYQPFVKVKHRLKTVSFHSASNGSRSLCIQVERGFFSFTQIKVVKLGNISPSKELIDQQIGYNFRQLLGQSVFKFTFGNYFFKFEQQTDSVILLYIGSIRNKKYMDQHINQVLPARAVILDASYLPAGGWDAAHEDVRRTFDNPGA